MAKKEEPSHDEVMCGIKTLTETWLMAYSHTINLTNNKDLAELCAESVIRVMLFGRDVEKEHQAESRRSKLINPDGSLNINEWLKGGE